MFDNKKILVTGGSGFIGSNIIKYLLKHKNIEIYNFSDEVSKIQNDKIVFIEGNLLCESDMEKLNNIKFDYIFHQAALVDTTVNDKDLMLKTNTNSFKKILNITKKHNCVLVYASSAAVYGNSEPPNSVGSYETPTNIYGESKLKMDILALDFIEKNPKLNIVGLRYFNVYGPGEQHKGKMASMIYQLYLQMSNNKNPRLFKYGEQKRDFVYINDIVEANIKAALSNKSGIYNIGFGKSRNFNDIVKIINKTIDKNLEIEYFDNPYDFYQNHTEADIANDIEYQPKYNLEKGIQDYISILKNVQ